MPQLVIATYPSDLELNHNLCAAQLRLALYDLYGAEWYIDNVLFNKAVSTQLFIFDYDNIGIGPEIQCDYQDGMRIAAGIKSAVDFMASRNDTLFFQNDEWHAFDKEAMTDTVTDNYDYIKERTQLMYNSNGFVYLSQRSAFFVEYSTSDLFRFRRNIMNHHPSVMLWRPILQSPFADCTQSCNAYDEYIQACLSSSVKPLPQKTNGLNLNNFSHEDVIFFLEHAVEYDRKFVAAGSKEKHVEPFVYKVNKNIPNIGIRLHLDTLDCQNIYSIIHERCQKDGISVR